MFELDGNNRAECNVMQEFLPRLCPAVQTLRGSILTFTEIHMR